MNKIITLLSVSFALSACGAIPTAADRAHGVATEEQSIGNNSGLGTIVYNTNTSAKCKKVRSTGSNIGRSSCAARDSGSQPVREGIFTKSVPTTTPGMNRPNN